MELGDDVRLHGERTVGSGLDAKDVLGRRVDRLAVGAAIKRHRVADLAQQVELESAQRDVKPGVTQPVQHVEVACEQALVGIRACEQAHEQLRAALEPDRESA